MAYNKKIFVLSSVDPDGNIIEIKGGFMSYKKMMEWLFQNYQGISVLTKANVYVTLRNIHDVGKYSYRVMKDGKIHIIGIKILGKKIRRILYVVDIFDA